MTTDRAQRTINALRKPDASLAQVPNAVRQSIAEVIEELIALSARDGAVGVKAQTQGPYEARICKEMSADCCDYGVVSLSEGREVCRVWREQDARAIAAALTSPSPVQEETERVTWRYETEAEHIARDMREGRFPERSAIEAVHVEEATQDALVTGLGFMTIDAYGNPRRIDPSAFHKTDKDEAQEAPEQNVQNVQNVQNEQQAQETTMSSLPEFPVDSEKGIDLLFKWARHGGFVLDEFHERIAKKYGVSTEGVIIRRRRQE